MAAKRTVALAYLDTNIVLDMLAPSRKNPQAQELLRFFKGSREMKGAVSSFCYFEAVEQIQLGVYFHRAIQNEHSLDEIRRLQAGPFDRGILKQAQDRLNAFLLQNSKALLRVDPEGSKFWHQVTPAAMRAKFEAADLMHLALAIGIGASSLITNDGAFYEAMVEATPRRLGLTPIRCNPKTEAGRLRRQLGNSRKRAGQKAKEIEGQSLERLASLSGFLWNGVAVGGDKVELSKKLDSLENQMSKGRVRKQR